MNKQELEGKIRDLQIKLCNNKAFKRAFKTELAQLKQQLKELPSLEVGKWYKYPAHENWLLCIVGFKNNMIVDSYGFNCESGWMSGWNQNKVTEMDNVVQATDKEVEQALIKEAKKRGFKEGVTETFKCLRDGYEWKTRDSFYFYKGELGLGANTIFKQGKWAEIIEQPKKLYIPSGDYTKKTLEMLINNEL